MKCFLRKILVAAITMGSCMCSQEPEKILYRGPNFVFFDSKPQLTLYENQKTPLTISVKVNLAQTDNTQVTFEVVGENVLAGSDYKVQTASPVEILRSKYGATISILPVDNSIIQPEKRTITVRIKSVNNPNLSVQVVKEVQINLLDDDCPATVPKVSIWVGNVNIQGGGSSTTTGTSEAGAGGICGGSLIVTGKFVGSDNPSSTFTIIMTQNAAAPTKGFSSVVRGPLFPGSTQYEYEASGTYDQAGKNISLNYTIYDTTNKTFQLTGTHIITPK